MAKKISYKDQRLTKDQQKKSKAIISAGVKNYIDKQENVTVPKKWLSSPDHVVAELAYITPREQKILLDADLYGSLNGKPNRGPGGIMSLQGAGDGGGSEDKGTNADGSNNPGGGNGGNPNYSDGNANTGTVTGSINENNQNTGNDNTDMQNYMEDQTTYTANNTTTNPTISDKDRDDFFKTPVGKTYKEAAEKAAKIKKDKKDKEKKEKDRIDAIVAKYKGTTPAAYAYGPPIKNYKKNYFIGPPTKKSTTTKMRQLALKNLIDKKLGIKSTMPSIFELNNLFNPSMVDKDYTYNTGITTDMMGVDLQDYSDIGKYGLTGKNMTDIDRMNQALDEGRETGKISQTEFEDAFYGPEGKPDLGGGSGGDDPIIYTGTGTGTGTGTTTDDEVTYDYRFGDPNANTALDVTLGRYFNQGGRVPRNMGGIMNAVPRQGYFLGKIVKGVKKVVGGVADAAGKVLKSDFGKAAVMALGGYYLGGGTALGGAKMFGNTGFGSAGFLSNLGRLKTYVKDNPFKSIGIASMALPFIPGINKVPENEDIGMADRGGSLIDPITGEEALPSQMVASLNDALANTNGDPAKIKQITDAYRFMIPKQELGTYLPYETYAANGGRIGRAEGGLMNLGGMEKDYRAEGGFVPIGREEKADDVPARLSVNEFVFTADAVRNAGGGDIDRGAEVMENMMKNLENGGRVSEESQGNTGAQDMFSVSERIGEVI
jgi:hypothetical protein